MEVTAMLYLWPQAGDVSDLPAGFGIMTRPADHTVPQGVRNGRPFAVDNEAFTRGFDPARFLPFDVLFIAGTTEWKLGLFAEEAIRHARRIGLPVHIGRVNSQRRFRRFQLLGADFCDGTTAAYGPDQAKRRLTPVVRQPALLTI
jgi:hypothetical protein